MSPRRKVVGVVAFWDCVTETVATPERPALRRMISGLIVGIGLLLLKLKTVLLLVATKFKPLLVNPFEGFGIVQLITTGGSMAVSLAAYAVKWGFWFAVAVVLLIAVHELGHALVIRAQGFRAGAMVFIPFVGGAVTLRGQPRSVYVDAKIGLAGPVIGTLAAVICLLVYQTGGSTFFLGIAFAGFILNLFNLMPIGPLDGGRIAAAITKWMWVAGVLILFWVMVRLRNPLLLLILLLGVFQMYRAATRRHDRFYSISTAQRATIAFLYFALVLFLAWESALTHRELEFLSTQAS